MNKNSTVSKGYGFVTFSRASEASRALESPRKIVCGKETISQYASTNRKGSETTSSDMRSSEARSSKYDDVGSYGPQLTDTYSSSSYSSSSYGGGRKDTSSSIQELPSQPALETYQYKAAVNNQPQYTQPTSATQYGSSTTQYGVQPSPLYNTGLQQQQPYQYSAVAQQGHPGSTVQYPQQQQQSTVYDQTNPAQNTLYQMPGAVPQQQYYSQQQPQTAMPQQQTQQFDQQHLQPQYTYQQPTNQPVYRQNPNYHN
jgi:RNA recognition motif-containing protein